MSVHDTKADTAEFESNPPDRLEQLAEKYFGAVTEPVRVSFGAMSHPGKVRAKR